MQTQMQNQTNVEGAGNILRRIATNQKEFNDQIDELQTCFREIVNLAVYTAKGEKDLRVEVDGKKYETKLQGIKQMVTDLCNCTNNLKQAPKNLNKRKVSNQNGKTGFSKQKLYKPEFINWLKAEKETFGKVNLAQIRENLQKEVDAEWAKKVGVGNPPRVPQIVAPRKDLVSGGEEGDTYIIDQISGITGFKYNGQTITNIANPSIFTPLTCYYTAITDMQGKAKPSAECVAYLKNKKIIEEVKNSAGFKQARKTAKENGQEEPVVTSKNYSTYVDLSTPEGIAVNNRIQTILNDNGPTAVWRNGNQLGATQAMLTHLGDATFKTLAAKDAEKIEKNEEEVKKGIKSQLRNLNEKPQASSDCFQFSHVQMINAINTVPENEVPENIKQLLTPGTETNNQLKKMHAAEADFASKVLEASKSQSGKIGKFAKRYVKEHMPAQAA